MSDDHARERELLDRIYEHRLLRDAQDPAGALHLHFQREIEVATSELVELRRVAPERARLAFLLDAAHRELARAHQAAEPREDPWSPVAGVMGGFGALLLLVALWLGLGVLVLACGAGLLGLAVLALSASVRHRRDAADRVEAAQVEVDRLSARRDTLGGTSGTPPGPVSPPRPMLPGGTAL